MLLFAAVSGPSETRGVPLPDLGRNGPRPLRAKRPQPRQAGARRSAHHRRSPRFCGRRRMAERSQTNFGQNPEAGNGPGPGVQGAGGGHRGRPVPDRVRSRPFRQLRRRQLPARSFRLLPRRRLVRSLRRRQPEGLAQGDPDVPHGQGGPAEIRANLFSDRRRNPQASQRVLQQDEEIIFSQRSLKDRLGVLQQKGTRWCWKQLPSYKFVIKSCLNSLNVRLGNEPIF